MSDTCDRCHKGGRPLGTLCDECAALPPVRSEPVLAAAIAVREYLESTEAICCSKFDIPDAVWVPFCKAIDTANTPPCVTGAASDMPCQEGRP